MARNISWDESVKENVLNLVEALLSLGDKELDNLQPKPTVYAKWEDNKLQVTGFEIKQTSGKRKREVEVGTRKEHLVTLIKQSGKSLKLPKQKEESGSSQQDRESEAVQTILDCLKELGVREPKKAADNKGYWKFTLTLKHQTATREENLEVVKQKWKEHQKTNSQETSLTTSILSMDKSIDWQNCCRKMLPTDLSINPLLHGDGVELTLDDIVPLELVERKQRPQQKDDFSPEGFQLPAPTEYELPVEHNKFLAQVLETGDTLKNRDRKIAIIGEPGAGKTTILQEIAKEVEGVGGLPIFVKLADLEEKALEKYLLEDWLKYATGKRSVSGDIQDDFVEQFNASRVWLLLDGVDEIAATGNLLSSLEKQLKGWVANARIVLTCRLNVWDVGKNDLYTFEKYRIQQLNYPDLVGSFIHNFFSKAGEPTKGEKLIEKLERSQPRIKDLVKNPLRLTLLCRIWKRRQEELPQTKAELYEWFVETFYEWKDKPEIDRDKRLLLNQALGELAKNAIAKETTKFRLRESFVRQELDKFDKSLFDLACSVGWIINVGVAAENSKETVYAFFHPTFQEYFAALAIEDWGYFLNHVPENPAQGIYRIFEPQWKEVFLLWLGCQEEDLRSQKAQFIQLLIKFDDGIEYKFYFYQALFIAAVGIAEFRDCPLPLVEEILSAIIMISFGCLNDKEQEWLTFPKASAEGARKVLLETDRERVIALLETLITSVYDFLISNQPLILCDLALMLLRIEPNSPVAINCLTQLRNAGKNWTHVFLMALHSWDVNKGYARNKIDELFKIWDDKERNINELIDKLIHINKIVYARQYLLPDEEGEIAVVSNTDEINALIHNFKKNSETEFFNNYSANTLYRVLSPKPANVNPLIEAFIEGLHSKNHTCRFLAITGLSIIGTNNQVAIRALTEVVQKSEDPNDRTQAVGAIADIGIGNLGVFNTLLEVVRNDPDDWIRTQAVRGLAQVTQGNGFRIVVAQLKKYLQITSNRDTFNEDKSIFYRECYETMWHCAQKMTYPDFHEAWHSTPTY